MDNCGNPGGWVCPECGPGVKADEDGCCKHCGRDADPDQTYLASIRARVEELEALKERVVLWAQDAYIDPDSGPDECRGAGCYLTDETCRELVAILAGGGKEGEDA